MLKQKVFFALFFLLFFVLGLLSLKSFSQQEKSANLADLVERVSILNEETKKEILDKLDKILANQEEMKKTLEFLKIRSYRGN